MYTLRTEVGEGIEQVVYPNGLTLLLRPDAGVPVAALRCHVRGGSIAEEAPGGRGIAHLLEHLIATAAAAEMEQHGVGALLNAYTTHDETCFHWSALEEDVVSSLSRFFVALRRAASLSFDLDAEKSVVLREIELFREKRVALFQQRFLEQMFDAHPLRYPVCGYAPLIAELTAADLARYIERLYTGANLRVVVSGAFDEQAVVAAIEEACVAIAPGHLFDLHVDEPPRDAERVFELETSGVDGGCSQVGLRILGDGEDAAVLAALAKSVNASRNSTGQAILPFQLEARSVVSAFHAGYFQLLAHHDGAGSAAVEGAMRTWLGEVAAGRAPLALEDDVCAAVARHLTPGNLTIGRLRQRAPRTMPRMSSPAAQAYEETLANGVRLLILPTPSVQASCQVLWRGGVFAETAETNGVCSLMTRLLPRTVPAESLASYRQNAQADFFAFCDDNLCGVSVTVAERELEAGLDLLATMATQPAFTDELVGDGRRSTAEWLATPRAAWLPQLLVELKQVLYRVHPYGRSEIGTADTVARLTIADVTACHRRVCVGDNTVVVVSGRVDTERIRERLAPLLAAVPHGRFSATADAADASEPGTRVLTREWGVSALAMGFRGVPWEPETWPALELLKALLVGPENNSVRGRLVRALREEGAAYSVQCQNYAGFGEGWFALFAALAPEREEQAVAIAARELQRLRDGDLSPRELDHCRKLYLLQDLRRYESPRAHAYFAGREVLFATRRESANRARELTVDDVVRAAQRTFIEANRGVVVVRPRETQPW